MKILNRPGLVFLLVFGWKVALFLLTTQPVPANDAFFYDGAVVNRVLNGGYFNPSLAVALPISGTEVFCAYPPLYQGVLWVWMSAFGATAWSAMTLHLVLFGIYELILLAIFKRLKMPVWCLHLAAAYLVLLTFHDRPDTLAHVLGMVAVYGWVRSWAEADGAGGKGTPGGGTRPTTGSGGWAWLMAGAVVLCWCASLQIGAIYSLLTGIGTVGAALWSGRRSSEASMLWARTGHPKGWTTNGCGSFPLGPVVAMALTPVALILMVKVCFPHLWAGFLEHAHQTPSFTGLRRPLLGEFLKVGRTAPGIILVALLLPWVWFQNRGRLGARGTGPGTLLLSGLLAALAVVGACLTVLTANTIAIANFLQPLIVGAFLAVWTAVADGQGLEGISVGRTTKWMTKCPVICLWLGVLLGSVRAVGMSTWGVACARDMSYGQSIQRVQAELDRQTAGSVVVLSSGYLYEAARHKNIRWLHSDWLVPIRRGELDGDLKGLLAQRPGEIIITQFDYYRRYQAVLESLKGRPALATMEIENTAHVPPPDAYKSMQQVVQHISWAPVIVKLSWR